VTGGYTGPFHPAMSLAEARDRLRPLAEAGGEHCPCCTQMVRVYRRKLTSVAVRALVALYTDHGCEYGHLPTVARRHLRDVAHQGGYLALSAHWGLMEDERHRRPDGGRAGLWRVTALGEAWLTGEATVPLYARIYDGRCLALDGDSVGVRDILGSEFSFAELMRSSAERPTAATPPLFDSPSRGAQEAA
jgi:hypothetical protein